MGLYLLNISVDPADPNPDYIPEDLSINDQESMVELIVEQLLGFEDAFEEFEDPDGEDHHSKKNLKIDLVLQPFSNSKYTDQIHLIRNQHFSRYNTDLFGGFKKISSPPPKV